MRRKVMAGGGRQEVKALAHSPDRSGWFPTRISKRGFQEILNDDVPFFLEPLDRKSREAVL